MVLPTTTNGKGSREGIAIYRLKKTWRAKLQQAGLQHFMYMAHVPVLYLYISEKAGVEGWQY